MSADPRPTDGPSRNGAAPTAPATPGQPPETPGTAARAPIAPHRDPGRDSKRPAPHDQVQPPRSDEPHDVLAAEEFAFPAGAPRAPGETAVRTEPHDVLAAEEFALPATNPRAPADSQRRPHDVLAAEEFAFPASDARDPAVRPNGPQRASRPALLASGLAGVALLALRARLRRRNA